MEGPLIILSMGGKGTPTKEGAGIKGTVNIISSDPLCKDGNVRFPRVPLKPFSDQ